jgi:hypothetical protein
MPGQYFNEYTDVRFRILVLFYKLLLQRKSLAVDQNLIMLYIFWGLYMPYI